MTAPKTPPEPAVRPDGVRVGSAKCARCGKPIEPRYRPFCSQRCADIDLGAWATGSYRIASEEAPGDGNGENETPQKA